MVWHLRSSRYMRAVAAAHARARAHTHKRMPALCQRDSKALDAHANASDNRNISDPAECTRPQR